MMDGDWAVQNPREVLETQIHIWNHEFGFIKFMSLKCVLELRVPDAIHNHRGPMTLDELVSVTEIQPSKAPHLHRIMSLLVHSGIFELHKDEPGGDDDEEGGGAYKLNDVSTLLVGNHPLSTRDTVSGILDATTFKTWSFMTAWLRNNDPTPFETAHGGRIWDRLASDLEYNDYFNESMAADTRLVASVLLDQHRSVFEGLKSLVDVGGGNGAMAKAIASAFQNMECTVLDLPHVVAGLVGADNLKFVAGDMFQGIPPANAVIMKTVLHDWDDEDSLKILRKCREAIPPKEEGGKLIIIDIVMTGTTGDYKLRESQLSVDLVIMVESNGIERSEKEWAKLFADAGYSSYKITPILGLRSVIEVYP